MIGAKDCKCRKQGGRNVMKIRTVGERRIHRAIMSTRREFVAAGMLSLGVAFATPALAKLNKLGSRPLRIVVPFAAGGGVDLFARLLAEQLSKQAGISVIVDNRPGGNGTIGGNYVRNAAPDGSVLLLSAATHVMAQQVMKDALYDPVADFAAIARVCEAPMLLVASPTIEANSIPALLAAIREAPKEWTFGVASLGSPGHLAELEFNSLAKLKVLIAPYRGTAPALTDVAGSHIQMLIDTLPALMPMAKSKQVKGLAVTTAKRTPLAPEYPAMAEVGLPGMNQASWYGVWGPKRTPPDLIAEVNGAINTAVKELEARGRLKLLGVTPVTESVQAFETYERDYRAKGAELLKSVNFEPA
jgi:tripartite-type tricarboxylate transporter receptor subunit TctC